MSFMVSFMSRNLAKKMAALLGSVLTLAYSLPAFANGIPEAWGIDLQQPGSPIEARIYDMHMALLWIISIISVFVLLLLLIVIFRFNKRANPVPSTTAHNVKLEIAWTLIPCLILIGIALASFPLLYYSDREPTFDLTLKVTGHQWYWSYEYPDQKVAFDSHAIWDSSDVTEDQAEKLIADSSKDWIIKDKPLRLLEVDNRVVLPAGKNVKVQIEGGDVEHSWFLPALAVNRMAVPGRLNQLWLKVDKEGIYYGQCSMICGNGHGFMPIVIEAVSPEKFAAWVKSKQAAVGDIAPIQHFAAK